MFIVFYAKIKTHTHVQKIKTIYYKKKKHIKYNYIFCIPYIKVCARMIKQYIIQNK